MRKPSVHGINAAVNHPKAIIAIFFLKKKKEGGTDSKLPYE